MKIEEKYMQRCLQLAKNGLGNTAPNPMVGAVIVHNDLIIGEGFHQQFGEAHAEPNAIHAVKSEFLLANSTLYVNLEPCSHVGKTPPCAALIIEKKIPRVVIGSVDPNPEVLGNGINMLQDAGVEVVYGVLDTENRELNKRFFTFQEKHRPYIILKWAQSVDEFMDGDRKENTTAPTQFSTTHTQMLNHKVRAEEAAILVGTNTVLMDNPQLTTRLWAGKNPLRLAIDRRGVLLGDSKDAMHCVSTGNTNYNILNDSAPTLIFTEKPSSQKGTVSFIQLDFSQSIIPQILQELYTRNINSLIVEGGRTLLQSFIDAELWDEARVEIAPIKLGTGVAAPKISMKYFEEETKVDGNKFVTFKRH
jgi:diaminohydroxyphosphoribosylaminopyrimidine deaminase/5-amino-6-(5-phosphoribosylamino)uracil reductase